MLIFWSQLTMAWTACLQCNVWPLAFFCSSCCHLFVSISSKAICAPIMQALKALMLFLVGLQRLTFLLCAQCCNVHNVSVFFVCVINENQEQSCTGHNMFNVNTLQKKNHFKLVILCFILSVSFTKQIYKMCCLTTSTWHDSTRSSPQ